MRTPDTIHANIERLSEERTRLWHRLSEGRDPETADAVKRLDAQLDELWHELRQTKATLEFGDRSSIVARARAEERLERAA